MKNDKMFGKVKWFKKNKGYGYIIGADSETYFFENINCVNTNDDFNENDEVLFIPVFGAMDIAIKVEKTGK